MWSFVDLGASTERRTGRFVAFGCSGCAGQTELTSPADEQDVSVVFQTPTVAALAPTQSLRPRGSLFGSARISCLVCAVWIFGVLCVYSGVSTVTRGVYWPILGNRRVHPHIWRPTWFEPSSGSESIARVVIARTPVADWVSSWSKRP